MKKVSLFLIGSIFSLGIMAQTTPANAPVNNPAKPAATAKAENKTSKTYASKKNLKKTGANKKPTHHVTPVKKPNTPAQTNDNTKGK